MQADNIRGADSNKTVRNVTFIVAAVLAVIVILLVIYSRRKKREQEAERAAETERILGTPMQRYGDQSASDLADKYNNQ